MINVDNQYNVKLEGVKLIGSGSITLGKHSEIRSGTIIEMNDGHLVLGDYSVIGYASFLQLTGDMSVGTGSLLGPHTSYIASSHPFGLDMKLTDRPLIKGKIVVCDNVWIGANCTVNVDVTINNNAVVGANSFVNKDVDENTVVGGTPAKFIRHMK